jgi:hypothetical protein
MSVHGMIWWIPTYGGLARVKCFDCAALTRHVKGRDKTANSFALAGNVVHMDLVESYRRGLKCHACGRID